MSRAKDTITQGWLDEQPPVKVREKDEGSDPNRRLPCHCKCGCKARGCTRHETKPICWHCTDGSHHGTSQVAGAYDEDR